ncbi:hypothetical protein GIB67_020880 [Kingdonia uniflora]|uniref:Serpin domain-containing protein n=1 Tax=Kingdonia uniflora TaxID=39325 RepID=A0A7J7M7D8_9MAGN|nr:hypothetical protein GIB67_020880 [Kingdonia uniflora]
MGPPRGRRSENSVNKWAEKATNGLIESVLLPGSIFENTELVLANALYFKGIWKEEFDESSTKDSKFYLLDGNLIEAPFMTTYADQIIHSFEDFKGLRLPYKVTDDTKELLMYIFQPHKKDGLWDLVKKVASDSKFLTKHVHKLSRYVSARRFMIPKFKISFGFEASKVFIEGGLDLPFSKGVDAGLHRTVMEKLLKVSEVLHRSFFEVNEEGTRAAAYTRMVI